MISLSSPRRALGPRQAEGRPSGRALRPWSKDRPAEESKTALRSGTACRTSGEGPHRSTSGHMPLLRATSPARNRASWPATPARGPASGSPSSFRAERSWRPRSGLLRSRLLPRPEAPRRVSAAPRLAGLIPVPGRVGAPPDPTPAAHAGSRSGCGSYALATHGGGATWLSC